MARYSVVDVEAVPAASVKRKRVLHVELGTADRDAVGGGDLPAGVALGGEGGAQHAERSEEDGAREPSIPARRGGSGAHWVGDYTALRPGEPT